MNCKCSLNDKLEAERNDVSFRKPKVAPIGECAKPHFDKCARKHYKECERPHFTDKAQNDYTKLYFNAGRFAAGARDKVATDANNQLWELFTNE
jgi:hypothetical protein